MTLDKQYGKLALYCDECGETLEKVKGQSFDAFIEEAKEKGWHFKKVGSDWIHFCGDPCEPEKEDA